MKRVLTVAAATAVLVAFVAPTISAQTRDGNRGFGLSNDAWCQQDTSRGSTYFCEVREEVLPGQNIVDVDASPNGGIRVRGSNNNDVRMRARIVARGEDEAEARAIASEIRIDTAGGTIRASGPRTNGRRFWTVSYELEVPRNAQLRLNATNGGISLIDFAGTAQLHTTNGGLTLADVGGDIKGRTTNGGLHVQLGGDRWEGAGLELETTNGGIHMAMPPGFSAELDARTHNGGVRVDVPMSMQGTVSSRRHVSGTLGSGGAPLRLASRNGGINISSR